MGAGHRHHRRSALSCVQHARQRRRLQLLHAAPGGHLQLLERRLRGLGICGGLVGGILAIVVYARVKKLDILMWLDFIAPNVLLAQAVGRLGNWVNQELYGPPTDRPWAFHINPNFLPGSRQSTADRATVWHGRHAAVQPGIDGLVRQQRFPSYFFL
ncbi:MAG: prolipoprotein diacylglyceryl transferase [Anaerolineales bacterium]|nr:prolipoprotein diacylglyceryl transferase [Anaerolineales bacterium]